jgi:hypothetical protein
MLKFIQGWLYNMFLKKYGFGWLYKDFFLHFRILLTDLSRFCQTCLGPLLYLLPKTFILFGLPIFWPWAIFVKTKHYAALLEFSVDVLNILYNLVNSVGN